MCNRESLKQRERELERKLRQLRSVAFDVSDEVWERDFVPQISVAKRELFAVREQLKEMEPVGFYSGLTRRELARTGTCETDWY